MPPNKILICSDKNELEYCNKIKDHFIFRYTLSKTKLNNLIGWTQIELDKLIANNIIK